MTVAAAILTRRQATWNAGSEMRAGGLVPVVGETMELTVPPRVNIAERVLFDEDIRKILREFDVYARAERAKGSEPSVARFHALRGKELKFSLDSLKRWLSLRRQFSER